MNQQSEGIPSAQPSHDWRGFVSLLDRGALRRFFVDKKVALALFTFDCFMVTCVMFFPGLADSDSDGMMYDAQAGYYQNWHSILIIFLLHQIRSIIHVSNGYYIWFLATMVQFWTAIGIIAAYHIKGSFRQVLFVLLVGFFPTTFFMLIANTKDSLMCVSLLLSYALILIARYSCRMLATIPALILAFLLLFVAGGERHNALFACWSLLICLASVAAKKTVKFRRLCHSRLKMALVGLVLLLAIWLPRNEWENRILRVHEIYPIQVLLVWDLVNISVLSQKVLLPDLYPNLKVPLDLNYLKSIYCESDASCLYWWPLKAGVPTLRFLWDPEEVGFLFECWRAAVLTHPLEYLRHRVFAFMSVLGVVYPERQCHPYDDLIHPPDYDNSRPSLPFRTSSPFLNRLHSYLPFPTFIPLPFAMFRGWPYVLSLLIVYMLFVVGKKIKLRASEYFLAQSGLLYTLSYLPGSVSNHQRYMIYPIAVAIIILATLLFRVRMGYRPGFLSKIAIPFRRG